MSFTWGIRQDIRLCCSDNPQLCFSMLQTHQGLVQDRAPHPSLEDWKSPCYSCTCRSQAFWVAAGRLHKNFISTPLRLSLEENNTTSVQNLPANTSHTAVPCWKDNGKCLRINKMFSEHYFYCHTVLIWIQKKTCLSRLKKRNYWVYEIED